MNNPSFDGLMLEAAAAAYNLAFDPITSKPTLTGVDPNGVAYQVDANGFLLNTRLATWGYKIEAGFEDRPTGFKALILSRVKADGARMVA